MRSRTFGQLAAACAAAVCTVTLQAQDRGVTRFYADDPIAVDRDTAFDASAATRDPLGGYADFVLNMFQRVGDKRPIPAVNVNTLGEVPDSSWFTNRLGTRPMSLDEIVRGPDLVDRLAVSRWVIVSGKSSGRQAGFRAVSADDPTGPLYQIEFDPPGNPEMATGAEIIGTAIYHALGYNVVDVYLVELDAARLTIAPTATIDVNGTPRAFTRRDLDDVLRRAARRPDGLYRATASRFAEGRSIGPFRYYGTRPDDPNDVYPHEHRRELRGNRVFCAWLNHDDSRAVNSLDMLVEAHGQRYVKHYMFDFGSILGSGTNEEDHPWIGHEYVVEARPSLLTLASFGLWRRPFIAVDAPRHLPAAGNFTSDGFQPARWKPHYPNAAFRNAQPEDTFWAARIVAAFTPEAITRIVQKAQFSDPEVVDHMTGTLLRRRELVLRTWLTGVNPIVNPRVDGNGLFRFDNAAVDAGVTRAPDRYEIAWFRFDNSSGQRTYVTTRQVRLTPDGPMPFEQLAGAEYVGVDISTVDPAHRGWRPPVRIFLRRGADGWTPVGLERGPEAKAERYARR
jgi:hypothetical protein